MKKCWHLDPDKRPTASDLFKISNEVWSNECKNPAEIVNSSHIGPIKTSNPGAIYKSRPLSAMIRSAESTRSLRSQSVLYNHNTLFINKRKFNDDLIENNEKGEV
jgi:hypothetical protein